MKTLILGGVRSGKSRLAERLARESGLAVTYVATATAGDEAMRQRIAAHQARRPREWRLIEEPRTLAAVLQAEAAPERCLLVECLTLWLTHLLVAENEEQLQREYAALLALWPTLPGQIIAVGNETNLGVIPMNALARRFCDLSGSLHQALAADCDQVMLTVAGIPVKVKP